MFDIYLKQAFLLVLMISGIPLLISSIVGFIVAILQSATQIQEQTLSYLIRFATVCLVVYLCSAWFATQCILFFENTLTSIHHLGRI